MNRREAITSLIPLVAVPAVGQQVSNAMPPEVSPEEHKRQYAICKVRGHQPDHLAAPAETTGTYYPHQSPLYVCKWCGTSYWIETKEILHETGAPE